MFAWRIFATFTLASLAACDLDLAAATIAVPGDFTSIQNAIDAADPGDTILVDAGTYRERIRLKPRLTVRSRGDNAPGTQGLKRAEATIIDGGGRQGTAPGVMMAAGSTLDGFTVTNVGKYDDALWGQHHATRGDEQSHEHIGHFGTPGIAVQGVTCTIKHNLVHHIGATGIAIASIPQADCSPHVHHNVCYRNMGGGIGSMKQSTALIEHNVCYQNFYAGIGHDDASPTVINNRCYENIRAGIGISHGSSPLVRGNQCFRNRRAGIGTRSGANTRPLIIDNECYENEMAGIGAEESAAPVIRANRCYKNKLAGIGVRTRATPTIVQNECFENEKAGIGHASDSITVLIDNHCHHNKAAGIGFDACERGRTVMLNNRVLENAVVAVGIQQGWSVTLTDNELARTAGMPPIVMVFAGAQAILQRNVIRGSGVAGVRVAGNVQLVDNQIIGDKMRPAGPPNFAVWALPAATVAMRENKIRQWRHGLFASAATITATGNTIAGFHQRALVIDDPVVPAILQDNQTETIK